MDGKTLNVFVQVTINRLPLGNHILAQINYTGFLVGHNLSSWLTPWFDCTNFRQTGWLFYSQHMNITKITRLAKGWNNQCLVDDNRLLTQSHINNLSPSLHLVAGVFWSYVRARFQGASFCSWIVSLQQLHCCLWRKFRTFVSDV